MLKNQYSVEVIGFNQTERIVLASVFGLAARRSPKFVQHGASAEPADMFLVDGSDANAVQFFRQRNPGRDIPSIIIGDSDAGTGWPALSRPLQWTKLFKAFDLAVLPPSATAPVAPMRPMAPMPPSAPAAYGAPSAAQAMPTRIPTNPIPAAPTALVRDKVERTQPMVVTHAGGGGTGAIIATNVADWVLVVDDNHTVREFMKSKLAPFKLNVDFAENGEQAVGLTGHKHYTCVFLDVVMPGIDGYQVCKLIKAKRGVAKTAVVMLTSKGSPFDKIRGAMAGCDSYLTKPVDEEKLLETIVKFLPTR